MKRSSLPASFQWLNVTQFLGVLNDNIFKLLVIFFLVEAMGKNSGSSITIVSVVFVVPFLLFSQAAGVLSDRFSKRDIIVLAKVLEIAVMAGGALAVYLHSPLLLYVMVFFMSLQSTVFSPAKYGIIPQLVGAETLSRANSILVGLTYLGIIVGTCVPTYLLMNVLSDDYLALAGFCVLLAIAGTATSLCIRRTEPCGGSERVDPFFVVGIIRTIRSISDRYLRLTIFGSAYFLLVGAFVQQNLLLYGEEYLKMGFKEGAYLFPIAALGIGIGALAAGRLSGRNIEFGVVPLGAAGLSICLIGLNFTAPGLKTVLPVMFLVGVSSGLFIVPLDAFIQYRSPKNRVGEIVACSTFLGFVGAALSSGLLAFLNKALGLSPDRCFLVVGALTIVLAAAAFTALPDFFVRFVVLVITRTFYRIRAAGLENVPVDGPALLVANHVSWVDALLISATQQRRVRYLMSRDTIERKKWLRPVFRLMGVIPVSAKDSPRKIVESLKTARAALDEGYLVCIFAEGAITRNGNMGAFKPGMERIVRGSNYPVIPVYIGGAWGSIFSYYHGQMVSSLPSRIPYPVTVMFGESMSSGVSRNDVRQKILEMSAAYFDLRKSPSRNLGRMFVASARKHWFRHAFSDSTGRRLTYGRAFAAALVLRRRLKGEVGKDENIGVLLPSTVAGALVNVAVTLMGRAPVNLNFTASQDSMQSAIAQAGINVIISSRAFLEKLEEFEEPCRMVFVEEVLGDVRKGEKIAAFLEALLAPGRVLAKTGRKGPDEPATVIFSSGSTGRPKGVVLSHHNIISNLEAFQSVIHFRDRDRMCGVLPFFHSFGFTCTLWCPALKGFEIFYHPNPVDGAKVAEIVRDNRLTILLSTPTFLLAYIRRASKEDFASLRIVIVGAEKLKKKIADSFEERFGVRPREGYGATELSPVVSLCIPDVEIDGYRQAGCVEGSVGHPLPGIAVKVVAADTGRVLQYGEQGVLLVKGPNVMQGYLNDPERTAEVLNDGWYNTNDVVSLDDNGFIHIHDRISRYSKIGGEMVPHIAVEDAVNQVLGTMNQCVFVSSAPDEKKGEQLMVFFTPEAGDAGKVYRAVQDSNIPNLWKPRKDSLIAIDRIPVLGSGKTDLKRLKELAHAFAESRPSRIEKAVEKIREII